MYITTRVWPASAQMVQALSKEEFLTVSNLAEKDHCCTFVEEQILSIAPLWRSLPTASAFGIERLDDSPHQGRKGTA